MIGAIIVLPSLVGRFAGLSKMAGTAQSFHKNIDFISRKIATDGGTVSDDMTEWLRCVTRNHMGSPA
jgi:hypothetical protein